MVDYSLGNQSDPLTAELNKLMPIAIQAYLFGYPIVTMELTRMSMTNVAKPEKGKGPMNEFFHLRVFPDDAFTDVVAPNADTLYSIAWLDVSKEPMVLSVPETNGRYYLMPMLCAWTDVFASIGSRSTGDGKGEYVILGPNHKGSVPPGLNPIRSPTALVWIIGRIQCNGRDDFAFVNSLQDKFKLTPLKEYGHKLKEDLDELTGKLKAHKVDPNFDMKTPPVDQVESMDAATFYGLLCELMRLNPPYPEDKPLLDQLRSFGIEPGRVFSFKALDRTKRIALEMGMAKGVEMLREQTKKPVSTPINGWTIMLSLGSYGSNYPVRAYVTKIGLGANKAEDAVYPMTRMDSEGRPLNGKNKYVMHFEKDHLPPVNGFWSLTMYDSRQFFVKNPLNRYALGDRDEMVLNPDGSLDIYVQNSAPGPGKGANWLPAPAEDFNVILRLYWPKPEVLGKTWIPPPIKRVG